MPWASAQDVHFSQFYSNSLLLNPAQAGQTSCNIKAGINYKSQWKSIDASYETQSAFIEKKIAFKNLKRDWIGIGTFLYNDNAGMGVLKTTQAMAVFAYHKALDKNSKFYMSYGAAFGFGNKSINYSKLIFDNQWTNFGFNREVSNEETLINRSFIYVDLNVGISVTYKLNDNIKMLFGTGRNHLNRPKNSFNVELGTCRDVSKSYHSEIDIKIGKTIYLNPKLYYTSTTKSNEFIYGINTIFISGDYKIYAGVWNRINRDIIGLVGFEFSKTVILISYDINNSELSVATKSRGGIEISLVKIIEYKQRVVF